MQAVNLGVFCYSNTIPCSTPAGSQSVFHGPAAVCVHRHLAGKAHARTRDQKGALVCQNQHCQVWNRVPDCMMCCLHYPLGVCDPWAHLHQQHVVLSRDSCLAQVVGQCSSGLRFTQARVCRDSVWVCL